MNYRFAEGADVELAIFAHIRKLSVLVFVDCISQWVQYSDPLPMTTQQQRKIFILLNDSHFQLVKRTGSSKDYVASRRSANTVENMIEEKHLRLNSCFIRNIGTMLKFEVPVGCQQSYSKTFQKCHLLIKKSQFK